MPRPAEPLPSGIGDLPVNFWLVGQEGLATQRQSRYLPAAIRGHPGKMWPALARRMIETFSRPDDWILDPLSGIGTTGVEAVHLGRHYVGIELEERYVAWQRQNLARARTQGATGRFAVFHADAHRLDPHWPERPAAPPLTTPAGRAVDLIITSPPYSDRLGWRSPEAMSPFVRQLTRAGQCRPGFVLGGYGQGKENIGNLKDAAYREAMRHVYAGSYEVLRPRGLLVVVLRPGRDHHCLRPLHHDTARLCQALGFDFLDEIVAIVSRIVAAPGKAVQVVPHAHFWRRLTTAQLREQGYPVTLEQLEYVLVFQKPDLVPAGLLPRKNGLSAALAGAAPHRTG
jgi:modification methylase